MTQVFAIARATLKEHSRRKLIPFFVIISVVVMIVLLWISNSRERDVVFGPGIDIPSVVSLGFLGFLGVIAALAFSMGNIGQPFENGEALLILARPVTRWQYALGRLLASILALTGLCALLAVEMQALRLATGDGLQPELWAHWGVEIYNLSTIAIVTTFFSVLISNSIIVAVVSFIFYQASGAIVAFHTLVQNGAITGWAARVIESTWYLTPKLLTSPLVLSQFSGLRTRGPQLVKADSIGMIIWSIAYSLAVVALILIFVQRKEI